MGPLNKKSFILFSAFLAFLAVGCSSSGHTPQKLTLSQPPIEGLSQTRQIIVQLAMNSLGVDYSWGGSSPQTGFDCSGLVVYTHLAAGVATPRTARAMYSGGQNVAENILPGDLVFFNSPGKSNSVHVGIFIGENFFIHAPGRGKQVRQAHLNNPYFSRYFIGARTFL